MEHVRTYGFYCVAPTAPMYNKLIPELAMITLPLYLEVNSVNPAGAAAQSYQVIGINKYLNEWLEVLNYRYVPTGNEKGPLQEDWFFISPNLPITNRIVINICVYYRKRSIYPDRIYTMINKDGRVSEGRFRKINESTYQYEAAPASATASYKVDELQKQEFLLIPHN